MTEANCLHWRQADDKLRASCSYARRHLDVALCDAERLFNLGKVDLVKRDELVDRAWSRYERLTSPHEEEYMAEVTLIWLV